MRFSFGKVIIDYDNKVEERKRKRENKDFVNLREHLGFKYIRSHSKK